MAEKKMVPELRFRGHTNDWEQRKYSNTFANIPNNTLAIAELNYNSGLAKNVHYGDVLIKFGDLLDVEKDEIPYITDGALVNKFRSSKLQKGDVIIADAAEDEKNAQALQNSEKDKAENLMIVDLLRNDLSKTCAIGSVKVNKLFQLQSFANVHHLVSIIEGKLKPNQTAIDLLRACFPGGSITGAPKLRAMQIIDELELHRRGLYCGAIGYIGFDGDMDTNITIRTAVVSKNELNFYAGGGIVADSEVQKEYIETLDKASSITRIMQFFRKP